MGKYLDAIGLGIIKVKQVEDLLSKASEVFRTMDKELSEYGNGRFTTRCSGLNEVGASWVGNFEGAFASPTRQFTYSIKSRSDYRVDLCEVKWRADGFPLSIHYIGLGKSIAYSPGHLADNVEQLADRLVEMLQDSDVAAAIKLITE